MTTCVRTSHVFAAAIASALSLAAALLAAPAAHAINITVEGEASPPPAKPLPFARPSKPSTPSYQPQDLSPQERAMLEAPVTDLNLSVRARKCLSRLGITSMGELVSRTADELLGVRNFGVTSLNEIRAKLGEKNLKLRND